MRRLGLVLGMLLCLLGASVGEVQAQPNPLQGPQTITVVDAGACATAGACASFSMNNFTVGAIEVSGTFTGTLTPEVLVNTVWVPVTLYDGTGAPFTTVTAPGAFSVANTGFARVRLRAGAFASGTATVYMRQGYFMAKLPGGGARILAPNGTSALPGIAFLSEPSTGFLWRTTGAMGVSISGIRQFEFANATLRAGSLGVFTFASGTDPGTTGADTGLSRTAVGQIGFGNGTQGDVSGTFNAAAGVISSNLAMGTTGRIFWSNRSQILSPADGVLALQNNALTTFTRLVLGTNDATANGIALGNAAGSLVVTVGDGSSRTGFQVGTIDASGNVSAGAAGSFSWAAATRSRISSPADGTINMTNLGAAIGSTFKVDALPTISSGFGTSPSITAGSTPLAGSINVGTGGVAASGVILFNGTAFPSAPFCVVTASQGGGVQLATTSTSQLSLGTSSAWPASTVVAWHCISPK